MRAATLQNNLNTVAKIRTTLLIQRVLAHHPANRSLPTRRPPSRCPRRRRVHRASRNVRCAPDYHVKASPCTRTHKRARAIRTSASQWRILLEGRGQPAPATPRQICRKGEFCCNALNPPCVPLKVTTNGARRVFSVKLNRFNFDCRAAPPLALTYCARPTLSGRIVAPPNSLGGAGFNKQIHQQHLMNALRARTHTHIRGREVDVCARESGAY